MIYMVGYQNISIAQLNHDISLKQAKIRDLKLKEQQLMKKQQQIFNYYSVIRDGKLQYATGNSIKIIH